MAIQGADNHKVYTPQRKVAKAVAGTIATAAVVTAGLALGAKNGKFAVSEESSAIAKKILPYLDTAGKAINKFVGDTATKIANSKAYQTAATKAKESGFTDAVKESLKKGKDVADDLAEKAKKADITGKAKAGLEKGKNAVDDLTAKVKAADIKGKFETAKQAVKDLVGDLTDKIMNPAKFDAAKAKAADIAEETFNGFVK